MRASISEASSHQQVREKAHNGCQHTPQDVEMGEVAKSYDQNQDHRSELLYPCIGVRQLSGQDTQRHAETVQRRQGNEVEDS